MSEWKTIDSAPKDGTIFLCHYRCGVILLTRWFEYTYYDRDKKEQVKDGYFNYEDGSHTCCSSSLDHPDRDEPTHWQPLPDAPK